jgi:hypothetical protein
LEIKTTQQELQKRKLMVCTPMFGGMAHGNYCAGMVSLAILCCQYGIEFRPYYLFNESLITRARNYCVDEFLRSGYTHLLFIDSDIGFNAQDIIAMLALQSDESEYDILAAPYPKKCISWEKIKVAVDKGMADEDAEVLAKYVGDYVFNPKNNTGSFAISEPVEVLEAGTGFMMIRRNTFEKFAKSFPQYSYIPDHARTEHFDGSREIIQYFQAEIDPKSKRYLSEDYWFNQKCWEIGLKTWLTPWISLNHTGSMTFAGSLGDIAALGVSPTVDPSMLAKNKRSK